MSVRRAGYVGMVFLLLFLFAPLVLVALLSFDSAQNIGFPMAGLTLDWYRTFAANTELQQAMVRSVLLGLVTAAGAGIVGTAIAVALVRYQFFGKRALAVLAAAPMVLPRIILGTTILLLMHQFQLPRGYLYLAAGHIVMALPYVVFVVSAQLVQVPRTLEEAAVNLGCGRVRTFIEVTLPLALPAVIAAMLFAFTISFQDAEASLMWVSPSTTTLPVNLLTMIRTGLTPEINVVAVVMIAVSVGLSLSAERLLILRSSLATDQTATATTALAPSGQLTGG
jgi:spermidine/putrescine transport system permease protein